MILILLMKYVIIVINVGANYARIKAEDKIWEGLGFVLQWAKYGLKK